MQATEYSILILLGLVVNLQCIPVSQSVQTRNPEQNEGLDEGDMVPLPTDSSLTGRGVAIRPALNNRWPSGVVPYVFAANITTNNTDFIVRQMRAMENLTQVNNTPCISFRPKTASDLYYITIFNGSGCYAPVGSWGTYTRVRPVSFMHGTYSTCMVSGIIQHELTHVLGFYHEQSRPDRDTYVSIQWANIDPNQAFNFDKFNDTTVDTQMTAYDYGSVMHYERNAFALNSSGPTIIPIQNTSAFIGQRVQLSPVDILEIQRFYGCVPTPTITSTTTSTTTVTTTNSINATTSTTTSSISPSTITRTTSTSSTTRTSTVSNGSTALSTNGSIATSTTTQPTATISTALKIGLAVGITCLVILCIVGCIVACVCIRRCRK